MPIWLMRLARISICSRPSTSDGVHRRLTPRPARREFGGVEQIKERYRDDRGVRLIDVIRQDLGSGVRQLRNNPVFAAVSIISIALGISATTAVFSLKFPVRNP
jgi:hypothetical protein